MVWPAVIGAAGALGASVLPSLFGGGGPSARDLGWEGLRISQAGHDWSREQWPQDAGYQAKATLRFANDVGIHPLAALGQNFASGSGYATPVGSSESGSAFGDGIAEAGRLAAGALSKRDSDRRAEEAHTATLAESAARTRLANAEAAALIGRTHAENSVINSAASRLMQESNSRQDLGGEVTFPSGRPFRTGRSTNQQTMEDEYGGAVGEVYGMSRFVRDVIDNLKTGPAKGPATVGRTVVPESLYPELY